jgi:hypothetical protein
MARAAAPAFLAGGTINPSRFMKHSTSANHTLLESDANEPVIGISSEAAQDAPIPGAGADAAASGEALKGYFLGDVCPLELGGDVVAGDYLKSDADGKGVAAATTGTTMQHVGAIALSAGASGNKILVQIVIFKFIPALS